MGNFLFLLGVSSFGVQGGDRPDDNGLAGVLFLYHTPVLPLTRLQIGYGAESEEELKTFINATKLPFIVKGVLSVEDAERSCSLPRGYCQAFRQPVLGDGAGDGFIVVGPVIKKLGVTNTLKVSFTIGCIATALRMVNPYHFVFNVTMECFATFATIPMMCLMGVMTGMSIDYNEIKYGQKMVASSNAASSFGSKIGSGVGASLIGWCLAAASYDAGVSVATDATKQTIFTFSIYLQQPPLRCCFFLPCALIWRQSCRSCGRSGSERGSGQIPGYVHMWTLDNNCHLTPR